MQYVGTKQIADLLGVPAVLPTIQTSEDTHVFELKIKIKYTILKKKIAIHNYINNKLLMNVKLVSTN